MAKQGPAWVKDLKAFGWFTLLNFVLVCSGVIGLLGFRWGKFGEVWLWVFACPCMAFPRFIRKGDEMLALCLNSLFYGVMGWFAWKMFRLMRSKPAE